MNNFLFDIHTQNKYVKKHMENINNRNVSKGGMAKMQSTHHAAKDADNMQATKVPQMVLLHVCTSHCLW